MNTSHRRFDTRGQLGLTGAIVVCAFGLSSALRADQVDYKPVAEILKVDVLDSQEKGKQRVLRILFNVNPNVPKDAKIEFELEYQGLALESAFYTLESEKRTNLRFDWTPKIRLPVDTYYFWTRMPVEAQPASVQKELKTRQKAFPPNSAPWPWNHQDLPVTIGTAEDEAAEKAEITKRFYDWSEKLLQLNGEFVDTCEEVQKGEKFVSKAGKLETEKFTKYVVDWLNKVAAFQKEVSSYPTAEPGLYRKTMKVHYLLTDLGRMVAKRCYGAKLEEALGTYKVKVTDLKIPAVEGLEMNVSGKVTPAKMERNYTEIARLANFPEEEGEE